MLWRSLLDGGETQMQLHFTLPSKRQNNNNNNTLVSISTCPLVNKLFWPSEKVTLVFFLSIGFQKCIHSFIWQVFKCWFCSVAKLCLTLHNLMDCPTSDSLALTIYSERNIRKLAVLWTPFGWSVRHWEGICGDRTIGLLRSNWRVYKEH